MRMYRTSAPRRPAAWMWLMLLLGCAWPLTPLAAEEEEPATEVAMAGEEAGEDAGEAEAKPEAAEESEEPEDPQMVALEEADNQLEERTQGLVDRIREEQDASVRKGMKEELTKVVNEHFDVRQKKRALEIERLEKQLENLRKAVEHRNEMRQNIIDRRLAELVNDEDLSF